MRFIPQYHVPAVVISLVFCAAPAIAQPGLMKRVEALEAQVASITQQLAELSQTQTTLFVDCANGESISAALEAARHRPRLVAILVSGVCTENLVITRSELLIRGAAPGAGIQAANPNLPVVRNVNPGIGSGHVALSDLTLSGGRNGVVADFGTQVQVSNSIIHNNGHDGVVADHEALVRLLNTTIENNGGSGITASNGAHVLMSGGAVRNHPVDGVNLNGGATAQFTGGVVVTANAGDGIHLTAGSIVSFGPAIASANGTAVGAYAGIFATGASIVSLAGGTVITENMGSGITLLDTSIAQKGRGETSIQITNNQHYGIGCSPSPAVAQLQGFNVNEGTITGNGRGAINCPKSPGPPQ